MLIKITADYTYEQDLRQKYGRLSCQIELKNAELSDSYIIGGACFL